MSSHPQIGHSPKKPSSTPQLSQISTIIPMSGIGCLLFNADGVLLSARRSNRQASQALVVSEPTCSQFSLPGLIMNMIHFRKEKGKGRLASHCSFALEGITQTLFGCACRSANSAGHVLRERSTSSCMGCKPVSLGGGCHRWGVAFTVA